MILYPSITVDLYKPYPLVILEVPQYNIGRGALVTLTAGGAAVVPTDEIIETYALKPDGTKVYNTAILAGNQVQINFSEQMTAVDGILQCELQMTDALGHSITTPIFAVRILPSNIDAKAITSSDDFQALVDALAQVQGFDQVKQSIGTLSELTTTAKDNLVAAINEVDGDIGDLSGLTTTAKNNLVAALNELNQNFGGVALSIVNVGNNSTTFVLKRPSDAARYTAFLCSADQNTGVVGIYIIGINANLESINKISGVDANMTRDGDSVTVTFNAVGIWSNALLIAPVVLM